MPDFSDVADATEVTDFADAAALADIADAAALADIADIADIADSAAYPSEPADAGASAAQSPLARLLAPLSAAAPCGPAARFDPVFTTVRLLREEDDASLPMGQWERPLKRADWPQIERLCTDMLTARSKDLQIAVWLVEAWLRQRGLAGLLRGLQLLAALMQRYWQPLHPVIDDEGDADARLAPLEWLNESLSTSVRLHVTLLSVGSDKPEAVTLADWERMTARELAPEGGAGRAATVNAAPALTRADLCAAAPQAQETLAAGTAALRQCLDYLQDISAFLHTQLGADAPNLGKLDSTLAAALRVLMQLGGAAGVAQSVDGRHDGQTDDPPARTGQAAGAGALAARDAAAPDGAAASADGIANTPSGWRNRSEAYATLDALADYLGELEPHSPTPFLIRRAARWGRMSLPEVITEIIHEEGDLSRFLTILGIGTANGG